MGVSNYRELEAWQVAMELTVQVYRVTGGFPESERFGLTNQPRRAAVSIPSNIAEGQGRRLRKQFCFFLRIAKGSTQEVETQLLLAQRSGMGDTGQIDAVLQTCLSAARLIAGLIRSIEPN
jgi:four helix bundle protein